MQPWAKQNNILTGLPLYTEIKMDSYSICVSTRLLINCSKNQVWRFICDVENMDRWVRGKEHNVGFKITKLTSI